MTHVAAAAEDAATVARSAELAAQRAADIDHANRLVRGIGIGGTVIPHSERARTGIKSWLRGGNRPPVKVYIVRLPESRMRKLDGKTTVRTECGVELPFAPLKHGTTVIEYGKGGGKTLQTIDLIVNAVIWGLVRKEDLWRHKVLFVTPRRNVATMLAHKLKEAADSAGLITNNYLDAVDEHDEHGEPISVAKWCRSDNCDIAIISYEQLDKLLDACDEEGTVRFALICDEFDTGAASFGGSTIQWPITTLQALKRKSTHSLYTILMSADVSSDGKAEAFVRAINPMNDVLHLQSTRPSMPRTVFLFWSGIPSDKKSYDKYLELSLHRSREARAKGTPNRTFFGGSLPKQVKQAADLACKMGVSNHPYHGGMSEKDRKLHFGDADHYMESQDLISMTTVGAIGTDFSLKCSWGFIQTAKGSADRPVAALRMCIQLAGRPGRDDANPLDSVTINGITHEGAIFVLIEGVPPKEKEPDSQSGLGRAGDRVDRKFHAARHETEKRLAGARDADALNRKAYDQRNKLVVQTDGGEYESLQPEPDRHQTLEDNLKEILIWNDIEKKDNYESHTEKTLELLMLPTNGCKLVRGTTLPTDLESELAGYRQQAKDQPRGEIVKDDDRKFSEMSDRDQYEAVWTQVVGQEDEFWKDCCGLKPISTVGADGKKKQATAPLGNGFEIGMKKVWDTLFHVKHFIELDLYDEMCKAPSGPANVYARAVML